MKDIQFIEGRKHTSSISENIVEEANRYLKESGKEQLVKYV